ncbi:MAG: phosphatidate cytidylyltransferase [Rhodospirillaceae bacterium]|jgi:phosphatidate cytidylyltransferase|nr:phosphatidate cytidylyltransferase [Rhodospirillaceae bacterium]MBT7954443.1 phosphatidate cytidylyltransferase [Rhodospirillaceae bacterium]
MLTRILSALVMAPLALAAMWFGFPYFELMVGGVGVLAALEWQRLIRSNGPQQRNISWLLFGLLYIFVPCLILVWLRDIDGQGRQVVIWLFAIIWATDIGAYFSGKSIGGPKLAPTISPNKTWAGFFGGLFFAGLMGFILNSYAEPSFDMLEIFIASVALSIVGQLGDLLESWVKRTFEVKDSGSLIPGHGGVLDRIDAILLAIPVAGIIVLIYDIGEVPWK